MPQHHQPSSLQKTVMTVIANNFEKLCYSCSSHEEMLKMIDSEEYLQVDGPFVQMHYWDPYGLDNSLRVNLEVQTPPLSDRVWLNDVAPAAAESSEVKTDPKTLRRLTLRNKRFEAHHSLTEKSKIVDLLGYLHGDMFNQEKYLLNGTEHRVKSVGSKDGFSLIAVPQIPHFKVHIVEACLLVRRVKVSPSILSAHAKALNVSPAKHPITHVEVKTLTIPTASHLIEDMAEEMKHVTHLRRHHLHIFLTSSLTTWTNHGVGDLSIAFELLKKRCKKLKKLNISYLKYLNPNVLLSLVPCFSNLVSLNLKMTLTVDQLLRSVGMKCPNLVDLNIASTAVTDRGIVQLCISEDGQRQCQKLARLIINDAFCITTAGAIIALQSLPNLREFDYENIFEAIQGVECWDEALEARLLSGAGVRLNTTDSPSPSSLQLTTLISSSENVQSEGLEAAVRLCPDAQSIILSNSWLPNEALYKLMAMENLTSISITNSEGLTIDFYDGILPLLCACGHHLQNLILANFTAVDITGLGKACPELKNLALSNVAQYESVSHPSPELFTKLQALELWSDPHADISLNMVKQLLSFSENIRNILLKGCEVISDKLLLDIWKVNPMTMLHHLTLDQCHNLSSKSLHILFNDKNELAVLRVWACLNIKKCNYNELNERICSENLDLYFEWFPYEE